MVELLKCFYFSRIKPGQRIYDKGDKIDKFVLILSGKVAIYYLELARLK
jgi:CRP-like cAMP-binding protein